LLAGGFGQLVEICQNEMPKPSVVAFCSRRGANSMDGALGIDRLAGVIHRRDLPGQRLRLTFGKDERIELEIELRSFVRQSDAHAAHLRNNAVQLRVHGQNNLSV
jgi:hypothetical protein